jgi:hypothetical protein
MKHVNNGILCKFWFYFWYATGPISGWLMVIVSLDRFLTIVFPQQFSLIHKAAVQIVVIFSIAAYNYLLYSSMIWNTEIKTCNNKLLYFYLKLCYCFKILIVSNFVSNQIFPFLNPLRFCMNEKLIYLELFFDFFNGIKANFKLFN